MTDNKQVAPLAPLSHWTSQPHANQNRPMNLSMKTLLGTLSASAMLCFCQLAVAQVPIVSPEEANRRSPVPIIKPDEVDSSLPPILEAVPPSDSGTKDPTRVLPAIVPSNKFEGMPDVHMPSIVGANEVVPMMNGAESQRAVVNASEFEFHSMNSSPLGNQPMPAPRMAGNMDPPMMEFPSLIPTQVDNSSQMPIERVSQTYMTPPDRKRLLGRNSGFTRSNGLPPMMRRGNFGMNRSETIEPAMPMASVIMQEDNGVQLPAEITPVPVGKSYLDHTEGEASLGAVIAEGGCANCGNVNCTGCGGVDYDLPQVRNAFDCCGSVSCARRYGIVEALYYSRQGDIVFGGNFAGFNNFDFTGGGRVTIGNRIDCAQGWEASYMTVDPWIAVTTQTDAAARLRGNFIAANGFPLANISAFQNATFLEQFQKTDLHSLELQKTWWGWDVVKTHLGWRYIHFDDEFRLSSANNLGQTGFYFLDTTNNMFGPELGAELFYDIGYRLSFSFKAKIGGYVNFRRGRTAIVNDGFVVLNRNDNDTDLSASLEAGAIAHYQITRRIRARVGYEALALYEVATTKENFGNVVTPQTGVNIAGSDSAFFHGLSAGIEIFR